MILTAINFILFTLQVLLLPAQIYSYLELRIDRTRLRFLIVAASFVAFNALWLAIELCTQIDAHVGECLLIYSGILLISLTYYYISRELGLPLNKYSVLRLLLLLLGSELLRESALHIVTDEFLNYSSLFFFIVFQIIAAVVGTRLLLLLFRRDQTERSPFANAAIGSVVILMFLPLVLFHVQVQSLYNVMLNSAFALIAFAYFKHFVIRLKLQKKMFPPTGFIGENLQEQFVRVPDVFFEYDLSARERQIAIFILKGMSYEEIATKLFRSPGAVRKQGSKAYAKAGVKNLQEFRKKFEFVDGRIAPRWNRK